MGRNVSKSRFTAIALVAMSVLCTCGGCDDPADLLSQANGYTSAVALNMAARGWEDFPSTPLALVDYARDLRESISEAKSGGVGTAGLRSLGCDVARPLPAPVWQHTPLGEAFGVPGGGE